MLQQRNTAPRQRITAAFKRHGAPFARRLSVHSSCVNALAWSGDGRWLASAGDDKHIALWDVHPPDELSPPLISSGPRGNVLCLAFSASDSHILSGGMDQEVLQYDISRMSGSATGANSPITRRFSQHEGAIRAISPHPQVNKILLTGGEDGLVMLHDFRAPPHEALGSLSLDAEVTSTQHHPTMDHVFVTSDGTGNCHLRDTRTAFGGSNSSQALLKYVTRLAKPGSLRLSNPEVSSVVFDRTGTRLAATIPNYLPTIYNVWDEWPLATCSATPLVSNAVNQQSSHAAPSYVNSCTIKHGSFGNPGLTPHGDSYYGAGSDDFRGYVWLVPDVSQLTNRRTELCHDQWAAEPFNALNAGFAKSTTGRRVVPVALQNPHFMLYGHRSIVNTVLFHPLEPYIATSGIERHVFVHSPFAATPAFGALARMENKVRTVGESDTVQSRGFASVDPDDDDERMIARFDEILRREGTVDIWDTRDWKGDDSEDPSSGSPLDVDTDADTESDESDEGQDCSQLQY